MASGPLSSMALKFNGFKRHLGGGCSEKVDAKNKL